MTVRSGLLVSIVLFIYSMGAGNSRDQIPLDSPKIEPPAMFVPRCNNRFERWRLFGHRRCLP